MTTKATTRALITVGAVFYSSFLIEIIAGYPLPPTRAFLSELAARNQATSPLLRTTDMIAGLCFTIAGLLAISPRLTPRKHLPSSPSLRHHRLSYARAYMNLAEHWREYVSIGFLIAGIATILDSIFPMDCAESSPSCASYIAAGAASISHHIHAVTSSFAGLGIMIIAGGAIAAWRKNHGRMAVILRWIAWGVVVTMLTQIMALALGWPIGIVQRLQVVLTVVMFIVVAFLVAGSAHQPGQER